MRSILVVGLSLFVLGCQSASHRDARSDARMLVQNWVDAINSGNGLAAIDQYIASDYVWHLPGQNIGREGVKEAFADTFQKCPKFKTSAEQIVVEGEWVVVRWSEHCSPDVPATTDITMDRFGHGQFLEGWEIDADKPWLP